MAGRLVNALGSSALAAEALQKMGYTNVVSMDGGIREWRAKGLPEDKE